MLHDYVVVVFVVVVDGGIKRDVFMYKCQLELLSESICDLIPTPNQQQPSLQCWEIRPPTLTLTIHVI